MRLETIAIRAGDKPERAFGAISTPIYQTSTFAFEDVGRTGGYDYSRTATPTREVLEDTIVQLEGGKVGFAFATGMAAETAVIHLLKAGDVVTNIHRADLNGHKDWVILELEGKGEDVERGIAGVIDKGIRVDPIVGGIVEG